MTETKGEAKAASKPKMVTIKLPLTRYEKDDVYVAVNGRTFLIKRGEEVQVPVYVKEVLDNKEKMLRMAYDFEAEASSKADARELR